jgi:hypothetical protein
VIPEIDIWRVANLMLRRNGDKVQEKAWIEMPVDRTCTAALPLRKPRA